MTNGKSEDAPVNTSVEDGDEVADVRAKESESPGQSFESDGESETGESTEQHSIPNAEDYDFFLNVRKPQEKQGSKNDKPK